MAKNAVYGGISGKRYIRRHIGPLLTVKEKIMANDTEEAELQNVFFDSVFTETSVVIKQRGNGANSG